MSKFDLAPGLTPLTPEAWRMVDQAGGRPQAQLLLRGDLGTATLTAGVDPDTDEVFLQLACTSKTPGLQSAQWGFFGLDLGAAQLVIPGQAGTYFSADSDPNFVGLDYPTHWESQFVVYEHQRGSMLLYAHEPAPNFKRLHASRENGTLDLGFETFAVAPWSGANAVPVIEWRLKGFAGGWQEATGYYKQWWRSVAPRRAAPAPEWTREIRTVVTVRYLDPVILDELAARIDPAATLLYLVSWRRDGFDLNYPDYTPGGDALQFVTKARDLGFRIMLHTNALGVSETNPDYERLKQYQLRTPNTLEPVGWLWDLEPGDTRRIAYISPCSSAYRQLFIERIKFAVETLQPDAIHLDAGGTIQNDGNGLLEGTNTIQGLIQFQQELLAAYPGIALGYESLTEINAPFISFTQRWSSESPGHPIGAYLFGDQSRAFGFLDQPAPEEDAFIDYLRRYERQGILPTAPIFSRIDFGPSRPRLELLLKQFRRWQEYGFEPDWDSAWDPAFFRFKSRDGQSAATLQQEGSEVTLRINGEDLYRRLRGTTSANTDRRIRDWPGYSSSGVTGLDPSREYWLESGVALPLELPHIEQTGAGIHIRNDSFLHPAFALLSLDVNRPRGYSFAEEFSAAAKGTFYRGLGDRGLINGAVATVTPVQVGRAVRNAALVMHPPYRVVRGGVTFVEFSVRLPDSPAAFEFDTALADASRRNLPTVFAVWVNGEEIWRNWIGAGGWSRQLLDLAAWRGQTIKLRLISGPDANQNAVNAIACWSNLRIVVMPDLPGQEIQLRLPPDSQLQTTLPSPLRAAGDPGLWVAQVDVPTRFAVFTAEPPLVRPGDSLLDTPAALFRNARHSLPSPYQDERNGTVRTLQLGEEEPFQGLYIEPPTDGRIYATWAVRLSPEAEGLDLRFGLLDAPAGLSPTPVVYSGASFHVLVNGEEVFSERWDKPGAHSTRIPLNRWAGQPVIIQVAADAEGTAVYDWCFFAGLRVEGPATATALSASLAHP